MIERRRRCFTDDSLLVMPISRFLHYQVQFARVLQSATGIITFPQLDIATSTDAEKLVEYAEGFWFVIGQW